MAAIDDEGKKIPGSSGRPASSSKKKTKTVKKKKKTMTVEQRKAAAKKRAAATAFARSQLKAAGIKPKKGAAAQAQFRAANKAAAKRRTAKKLGTPAGTGAASALTAGSKKGAPRPKMTAEQFAVSQLKRGGIKPVAKGDVKAQFRKENAAVAKKRAAARLSKVGASSALAAGMRGKKLTAAQYAAQRKKLPKPVGPPKPVKPKAKKSGGGGTSTVQ